LPTTSSAPSVEPTVFTDDIFNGIDRLRESDPTATTTHDERKCNERLRTIPQKNREEFELSFIYGVESTSNDYNFIVDLERMILEFVATSVLRCPGDGGNVLPSSTKLRKREGDGGGAEVNVPSVVRIRYPKHGQITSMSECDPISSQAQGCVVLNTKLLVTSSGDTPVSEVHHDVLAVLSDAFREDTFTEFIPELIDTSYLGPDPEAVTLSGKPRSSDETMPLEGKGGTGSTKTVVILLSLGCAVLLLKAISCFAFPTTRVVDFRKVLSYYGHRPNGALPMCIGALEEDEELDGPLVQCRSQGRTKW